MLARAAPPTQPRSLSDCQTSLAPRPAALQRLVGRRVHRLLAFLVVRRADERDVGPAKGAAEAVRQVDEHETILESHYQQWDILEHIRLVDMDRYRARSIYSWCNGELVLAEVHHEERLESSGQPLTS